MKIVQFMASTGYGGAEMVFVELSNSLAKRHEVWALVLRNTIYVNKFDSKVKIVTLTSNPTTNNPFLLFEMYSCLKRIKPDIIHTHAVKGAVLISRINRVLRLTHLATKHNDRKGRIFNSLPWVSAVSQIGASSIIGTKPYKRVIANGVDPVPLPKVEKKRKFSIVSIGRLDEIKGFKELIEQVSELDFEYTLDIVGVGPQKEQLQNLIESLGVGDKVSLPGYCDDIATLMAESHAVVITSHKEGGPKTAIEALFYADVLLSTRVGMVPEILPEMFLMEHGEIASKMSEVYGNYPMYCKEFEKVKDIKDQFLFSTTVAEYEKYYSEIISKSSK